MLFAIIFHIHIIGINVGLSVVLSILSFEQILPVVKQ